jgi:serine/threonine protein kinase
MHAHSRNPSPVLYRPRLTSGALLADRYEVRRDLGPVLGSTTLYSARDRYDAVHVTILCGDCAPHELPRSPARAPAHPFLATLLDAGITGSGEFAVFAGLGADQLDRRRQARPDRTLEADEAIGFAIDALAALGHLHTHGLTHGSLAPHDLWVTTDERLQLLPFTPGATTTAARRAWMSPERLRGQEATTRSDLYALAAILYELLVGRPPFGAEPELAEHGHLYASVPSSERLPPGIYPLLRRALAKQPVDRFPTAATLRTALLDLGYLSRHDAFTAATAEDNEPTVQVAHRDSVPTLDVRPLVVQPDGRARTYAPAVRVSGLWLDLEEQLGAHTDRQLPAFVGDKPAPGAPGRQYLTSLAPREEPTEPPAAPPHRSSTTWTVPTPARPNRAEAQSGQAAVPALSR